MVPYLKAFAAGFAATLIFHQVEGGPELVELEISPEVVDPDDIEMLQDLVIAAVRQAMEKAVETTNEELGGLTGGLGGLLG